MMEGRPVKFRLLEYLHEHGTVWNYDLIRAVMDEYGMKSDYERDCLNFDLIELAASGFIEEVSIELDTEGKVRKDRAIFEYRISSAGETEYQWLVSNIGGVEP